MASSRARPKETRAEANQWLHDNHVAVEIRYTVGDDWEYVILSHYPEGDGGHRVDRTRAGKTFCDEDFVKLVQRLRHDLKRAAQRQEEKRDARKIPISLSATGRPI